MSVPFKALKPGRLVVLKPQWRKIMGFSRGRIIKMISSLDKTIVEGGYYTVQRLDGAEELKDLTPDLHRLCFVPSR